MRQNFPIKTDETVSLFLQHFIKILKAGGKAGVVIKNNFLSHTDNVFLAWRKELLCSCNLHIALYLLCETFTRTSAKTVVFFVDEAGFGEEVRTSVAPP